MMALYQVPEIGDPSPEWFYAKKLGAKEITRAGKVGVPSSARELVSLLNTKSPVNKSERKSLQ